MQPVLSYQFCQLKLLKKKQSGGIIILFVKCIMKIILKKLFASTNEKNTNKDIIIVSKQSNLNPAEFYSTLNTEECCLYLRPALSAKKVLLQCFYGQTVASV